MLYEIKSLNVWSVAKLVFIVALIIHLLLGVVGFALISFGINAFNSIIDHSDYYYEESSPENGNMPILVIFAFVFAIGLSFGYMILSSIIAVIFNGITGLFGGIEVRINEIVETKKTKLKPKAAVDSEEEDLSL